MREDDLLAETLGIDVVRCKMLAFFIGSFYAAVGGALYARYVGFISPRNFDLLNSLNIWLMVAFGGRGTIMGPIVGTVILAPVPFLLQQYDTLKDVIYGALIIAVIVVLPAGIYGELKRRRAGDAAQPRRQAVRCARAAAIGSCADSARARARQAFRRRGRAERDRSRAGQGRDARHDRPERLGQDLLRQRRDRRFARSIAGTSISPAATSPACARTASPGRASPAPTRRSASFRASMWRPISRPRRLFSRGARGWTRRRRAGCSNGSASISASRPKARQPHALRAAPPRARHAARS